MHYEERPPNVECAIGDDGCVKFYHQDKRRRLPLYKDVIIEKRWAYLVELSGKLYRLGQVPEDARLISADNYVVLFISETLLNAAKKLESQRHSSALLNGRICPYCGEKTRLEDSRKVFGASKYYQWVWVCIPCDAWVGVHKGTKRSLGRLANAELRRYKSDAYKWFDGLWKAKAEKTGMHVDDARKAAYRWLAKQMDIGVKYCRIGQFDVDQCKKVIELCKPYYGKG